MWKNLFPSLTILEWGRGYQQDTLISDLFAALIVTVMLIPQSLAYAMLAGLPPEIGLYASMAPLLLYAIFGSSRVLAVGPVAVVSLMTASSIGQFAAAGSPIYYAAAMTLAFLSGLILLLMGLLRLGFLTNFLSHPVISGFITASGLLIAANQVKTLLGVTASGENFFDLSVSLATQLTHSHGLTSAIGLPVLVLLFILRSQLKPVLIRLGLPAKKADLCLKASPVVLIIATTSLTWAGQWQLQGVKIVGTIPQGLPPFTWPSADIALWRELMLPALLISIVGFVESISIGQTLAAKKRQRIDPNQELVALGASNLSSAMSGGFPVTGGFARSVVNFDAGAQTPAAGIFTALGIAVVTLFLTPALYFLPQATLAATIIVSVLTLVDFTIFKTTWRYSKSDFAAVLTTLLLTLGLSIEAGLISGVIVSIGLYLYRSSQPHIAEIGLVAGTEHFRNVKRHAVITDARILGLRVDESLYFANAKMLEDCVNQAIAGKPQVRHLVLQCAAINHIDASALESLSAINHRLKDAGVTLHLSEVKGPVMDQLNNSPFLEALAGQVFLSHYQAVTRLSSTSPT